METYTIEIQDQMIRLGQLLKLANIAEDGGDAKGLLAQELVQVNNKVETRRGRQVHVGDTVLINLPSGPHELTVSGPSA